MKPLSQLAVGQKAEIDSIEPDAASANVLSALGLLPGQLLEVKGFAPLGDPISIQIGGQHISLRKSDAKAVLVKEQ